MPTLDPNFFQEFNKGLEEIRKKQQEIEKEQQEFFKKFCSDHPEAKICTEQSF